MGEHRVAVVTDSTASLPADVASEAGVVVVPLHVILGGEAAILDGAANAVEVAAALRAGERGTTSQPSPEAFARAYADLAAAGVGAIVSVHLSGELSGTAHSAIDAAARAPVPVQVVDSRSVALGTGFAALSAARAAGSGAPVEEVVAAAQGVAAESTVVFAVQDLGYLHRGGRISATKALVGSVLGARPVLRVAEGRIGVQETVRGAGRAARRLAELAVEAARALDGRAVQVGVHHFAAEEPARDLAATLGADLAEVGAVHDGVLVAEVTAVVGVHTGPGVLGVVVAPLTHISG